MQQVDDPPYLLVGTEVSAKYKGAFCEAKVSKVVRNIKVKVAYKQGLGSGIVSDDDIKTSPVQLRIGAAVEVRHKDRKDYIEATVTKIQDCSQYTVVFDDGDITTLRRTALCLKSGRHFNESETLDQLPLTHPEHFGNPVVGGRRGRRRGHLNDDSSDEDDESDAKEVVNEKEEHIGKVVCVETETKKKDKEKWFPGLVVAPTAQATVRIRVKDEYLVRSFRDGRYYTVPKKEATEFTREAASKQDGPAVQAALEYLDSDILPAHWDRDALFGLSNSSSENDDEIDSDSSDDEPREEKDRFVAQLYKYMDDRGTPLNKVPSIQNKDVDLYRLFRAVQKRGGYNRVTAQNQWKSIALRLGFTPVTISITNLVKQAFKKFLQPYGEFHRKLGCTVFNSPRNSNRSKGRSLVRANSVASPKPQDTNKETISAISKLAVSSLNATTTALASATLSVVNVLVTEESENTSESSNQDTTKAKRKPSVTSGISTSLINVTGRVNRLVEKYDEKSLAKDDNDVPLSKMKTAVGKEKDDVKDREKEKDKDSTSSKDSSGHATRDSSPTNSNVPSKRDKLQRKPCAQTEDKRNKRRKDEIVVEKVDIGDFVVETGDKLKVYYHEKKVTYEAKVLEITLQRGTPMYLVHYTGWNNRYDEWVPRERIAENLTKGSKFKNRLSGNGSDFKEKSKENPPKPPSSIGLNAGGISGSSISGNSGGSTSSICNVNTNTKTPCHTSVKRGRGRSDSLPPRSTTPSSVASNSSRTKSPAAKGLKKRSQRPTPNSVRRTSTNASDASMATEDDFDTDSDEPVKRPNRAMKENLKSKKSLKKSKNSISAPNSPSDTDDNDEDDEHNLSVVKSIMHKGRDYDLNQIRSELKGLPSTKSTTEEDTAMLDSKDLQIQLIRKEKNAFDIKTSSAPINSLALSPNKECKHDHKKEKKRSSRDISCDSDTFGDDESQSSDKTTQLESMRKKFQQIINADKLRSSENPNSSNVSINTGTKVVEKIHVQGRDCEKKPDSSGCKSVVNSKDEIKPVVLGIIATLKSEGDIKSEFNSEKSEENKLQFPMQSECKSNIIQPTRFGNQSTNLSSRYSSVIVEKPLSIVKKVEQGLFNNKLETPKNFSQSDNSISQLETKNNDHQLLVKEVLKIEPPTACSPSSTSSTSSSNSSTGSSSASSGSRFLPDMSKLDISSSTSSTSTSSCSPSTASNTSTTSYASLPRDKKPLITTVTKPSSPDVYEFKDTEPFEFEIRKSPMAASTITSLITASINSATNQSTPSTSASSRLKSVRSESGHHSVSQTPLSNLVNRKKRGSPLKESALEKSKHTKLDEKATTLAPIVADAKLLHHTSTVPVHQPSVIKGQTSAQKLSTPMHAPATPKSTVAVSAFCLLSPQQKHAESSAFDALRKSPSFNLNINALNEELAQTVQETTRALTDVYQLPQPPPSLISKTSSIEVSENNENTPIKSLLMTEQCVISMTTTIPAQNIPPTIPKLSTPPISTTISSKINVGSPFIETHKDLKSVFELSFGSGSSSKDNKSELENAKVLLSATGGAFDLDPAKLDSKPTTSSIADKVLKAISQKKEEENKKQEATSIIKDIEVEKKDQTENEHTLSKKSIFNINKSTSGTMATTHATTSSNISVKPSIETSVGAALGMSLLIEPLKINTDHTLSSTTQCNLLSGPLSNFLANKRTPLSSPEPIMGLLESAIGTKKQLSETIQKLESSIQRRTPVTSHPVTPNTNTDAFSDESNDSTDSERRLVIEDVADVAAEQKSSPIQLAVERCKPCGLESSDDISDIAFIQKDIPTPIPIKALSPTAISKTVFPLVTTANVVSYSPTLKLAVTSTAICQNMSIHIPSTSGSSQLLQKSPIILPTAGVHQQRQVVEGSTTDSALIVDNNKTLTKLTSLPYKASQQATSVPSGVPIHLPDIPASVVVASTAVPSVMAAAQAAAAALQTPKKSSQKQQQMAHNISTNPQTMLTASKSSISTGAVSPSQPFLQTNVPQGYTINKAIETVNACKVSLVTSQSIRTAPTTAISKGGFKPIIVSAKSTPASSSGFKLDPRTELRPEDGLKPLEEIQKSMSTPLHQIEREIPPAPPNGSTGIEFTSISDTHDSIIQLRCEETIPGSPASVITGREDSQERTATCSTTDSIGDKDYHNNSPNIQLPSLSCNRVTAGGNSSPNDSGSQEDDSSEDLKKIHDVDNEVSPRKRVSRTRKYTESASNVDPQLQNSKRRRAIICNKNHKNTAGTDSEDNSDNISQRNLINPARQHHALQQQPNSKTCPYNFLVQLDPSLSPDQCIAILLKQIQDLRKTYNVIKSDLASIDRRRKKLRRREREKKQLIQNQQQMKVGS